MPRPVNISQVAHRSPFRYPGGKTWLVPHIQAWLQSFQKPRVFVEPFTGGGSVGLTVAAEGLAGKVVLIERDEHVAAVWETMLNGGAERLARRILDFPLSRERAITALSVPSKNTADLAFQTLLRNRVQRGGILAPGASLIKHGGNRRGISSRWYRSEE